MLTHSELNRLHDAADDEVDKLTRAEQGELALDWIANHHLTAMQFDSHLHEQAFQRLCARAEDCKAEAA